MSQKKYPRLRVRLLLERAELFESLSDFPAAVECYTSAVVDDTTPHARLELAAFHSRRGKPFDAILLLTLLLEEAKLYNDGQLRSVVSNNLAAVYREMGRPEMAATFQQQSVAAAVECGREAAEDIGVDPCDTTNLANDAMLAGNFAHAEQLIRHSLAMEVERGNLEGQAADWGSLGVVLSLQRDSLMAQECIWKAYDLHVRLGNGYGIVCDLLNLSQIATQLGRWDVSVRLLRHAIERSRQSGSLALAEKAVRLLEEAERVAAVATRNPSLN